MPKRPLMNRHRRTTENRPTQLASSGLKSYFKKWIDPAIVVNIILGSLTLFLLWETVKQRKISQSSLQEAARANTISQSALQLSKIKDSLGAFQDSINNARNNELFKLSKESELRNQEAFRKNFEVATKALEIQFQNLKELQLRFNLQNKPYLQVVPQLLKTDSLNNYVLEYLIENLSAYPVQILFDNIFGTIATGKLNYRDYYNKTILADDSVRNAYIIKGSGLQFYYTVEMTAKDRKSLESPDKKIFIIGHVRYRNLITKEISEYRFQFAITKESGPYFYENDNVILTKANKLD